MEVIVSQTCFEGLGLIKMFFPNKSTSIPQRFH
jgi:hypothetical protein